MAKGFIRACLRFISDLRLRGHCWGQGRGRLGRVKVLGQNETGHKNEEKEEGGFFHKYLYTWMALQKQPFLFYHNHNRLQTPQPTWIPALFPLLANFGF